MKSIIQVVAAAALFSTGGAAIKATVLPAAAVASMRSGIAAGVLLAWAGRRQTWSAGTLAVGAVYAATLMLFVGATRLTTSANAIFLQSAAPLYIAGLAPMLLGERFRRRDIVSLGAVGIGLAMCLAGDRSASATAPDPVAGNLLGLLCGLTWALTLIGLRWTARGGHDAVMSAVVCGNVIAFLAGLPAAVAGPTPSAGEWIALVYLGAVQIGLAYILLTRAVAHLPALPVSLLLLLEPVLNPAWTWLLQGERPGAWTLAGGAIIIVTNAVRAVSSRST